MTPAELINLRSLEFAKQVLSLSRDHEYYDTHTNGYYKDINGYNADCVSDYVDLYDAQQSIVNVKHALESRMGGYHRLVSITDLQNHVDSIEKNTKIMEDIVQSFKNKIVYKAPLFKLGQQVRIVSYEHTTKHSGRPSQYNIGDIMVISHANGNILSDDNYNFVHGSDVEIVEDNLRDVLLNRSWSEHTNVGKCCIALYDYFRKADIQPGHKLYFDDMRKQIDGSISDHDFITAVFYLTRSDVNILKQLFHVDLGEEGIVDVSNDVVSDMLRTGEYYNPVTLNELTPDEFVNTIITYFSVTPKFKTNLYAPIFSLRAKYVDEYGNEFKEELTEFDYLFEDNKTFASLYGQIRTLLEGNNSISESDFEDLTKLVDEESFTMPSGLTREQKMTWILKTAEEIKSDL